MKAGLMMAVATTAAICISATLARSLDKGLANPEQSPVPTSGFCVNKQPERCA